MTAGLTFVIDQLGVECMQLRQRTNDLTKQLAAANKELTELRLAASAQSNGDLDTADSDAAP